MSMFGFASEKTYAKRRDVRDAYTSREMEAGVLAAMDHLEEGRV